MPGILFLAYKYFDSPSDAIIANSNMGGDSVHRGAVLGAILGAMHGKKAFLEEWIKDLYKGEEIVKMSEEFVKSAHLEKKLLL